MTNTLDPKPALSPDKLYRDGGRVTCGREECAGPAAAWTGMSYLDAFDLETVQEWELLSHPVVCERCGFRPLVATDGAVMPCEVQP